MGTMKVSVQPIALYIQNESVIMWMDTKEGWKLAALFGALDTEERSLFFEVLETLEANGNLVDLFDRHDLMLLPLGKTSLPPALPHQAIIGMHKNLTDAPVPNLDRDGFLMQENN